MRIANYRNPRITLGFLLSLIVISVGCISTNVSTKQEQPGSEKPFVSITYSPSGSPSDTSRSFLVFAMWPDGIVAKSSHTRGEFVFGRVDVADSENNEQLLERAGLESLLNLESALLIPPDSSSYTLNYVGSKRNIEQTWNLYHDYYPDQYWLKLPSIWAQIFARIARWDFSPSQVNHDFALRRCKQNFSGY